MAAALLIRSADVFRHATSATAVERSGLGGVQAAPSVATKPGPSLKRLLIGGGLLGAVIAGSGYGHHWWTVGRFMTSTEGAYVGGDVTKVGPPKAHAADAH